MVLGLFGSKRQKIFKKYHELFEVAPIYGAVYGYLLRSDNASLLEQFKSHYDEWRQLVPLLIDPGASRDEASIMVDELFNAAITHDDLIQSLTDAKVRKVDQQLIVNNENLRDILNCELRKL